MESKRDYSRPASIEDVEILKLELSRWENFKTGVTNKNVNDQIYKIAKKLGFIRVSLP